MIALQMCRSRVCLEVSSRSALGWANSRQTPSWTLSRERTWFALRPRKRKRARTRIRTKRRRRRKSLSREERKRRRKDGSCCVSRGRQIFFSSTISIFFYLQRKLSVLLCFLLLMSLFGLQCMCQVTRLVQLNQVIKQMSNEFKGWKFEGIVIFCSLVGIWKVVGVMIWVSFCLPIVFCFNAWYLFFFLVGSFFRWCCNADGQTISSSLAATKIKSNLIKIKNKNKIYSNVVVVI